MIFFFFAPLNIYIFYPLNIFVLPSKYFLCILIKIFFYVYKFFFFFFPLIVLGWGVALAQGLPGLTPGLALDLPFM